MSIEIPTQGPPIIEGVVVSERAAAPSEQAYVTDPATLRALDVTPGISANRVVDNRGVPQGAYVSAGALDTMPRSAGATSGYDRSADIVPRTAAELLAASTQAPLGATAFSGAGIRPPFDTV